MTFLLACFIALPGCSADFAQSVGPAGPVASVEVAIDSSTLSVGHVAQASLTANDTTGTQLPAQRVVWTSITPEIATVDSEGTVTAVQTGEAIIEGRVSTSSARVRVKVVTDPNLASNDFDSGSLRPYTNLSGGLDLIPDPTGSGRGNVARLHFAGSGGDDNHQLEFMYPRRYGEPLYFRGSFYLPGTDLSNAAIIRKLVYWKSREDWGKYPKNGGLASGRTVVLLSGDQLIVDATFNPEPGTGRTSDDVRTVATLATGMQANRWYTLEVFQQMESAIGKADGTLQIWVDGKLLFEKYNLTWTDPAWVGDMSNGVPFEASDIYFEQYLVGQQVNWNLGSFDEYRYWDDVAFSTRPIR
jgi:hypothetical protein